MNNTDASRPRPENGAAPATGEINWERVFLRKWSALGRETLGRGPRKRRPIKELVEDCQALIGMTALFETEGNITYAAERLGTSRRPLREMAKRWKKKNPGLVPTGLDINRKRSTLAKKPPKAGADPLRVSAAPKTAKRRRTNPEANAEGTAESGRPTTKGRPAQGKQGGST